MRSARRHVLRNACLALALVLAHRGDASGLCRETSVKESLASAETVIEARVLEIRPSDPAGWRTLRLDVTRVWKPRKSRDDVLAFDSDERPPFEVGKTYLMFISKRSDGRLAIGRCSPLTKEVSQARREIEELFRLGKSGRG